MAAASRPATNSATVAAILGEIETCHAKAISFYADAISLDERAAHAEAVSKYLQALQYCEEGLQHDVFELEQRGQGWNDAREMQERLIITQGNVKQRIYDLQQQLGSSSAKVVDLPPAYSVEDPINPAKLPSAPSAEELEANTLLIIENGVQMYFVSSDDQVGAPPPSYPTSLVVIRLDESSEAPGDPEAIVQVGDKAYPLVKDQMPVYKSVNGVYMFPNCNEAGIVEGSFGVVIPQSISREIVQKFESILEQYGAFKCENPDDCFIDLSEFVGTCSHEDDYIPPTVSDRIAQSIISNAKIFSEKLQRGTRHVTNAVETQAEEITSKGIPSKSGISISPMVKKGLEYTNSAAKTTVLIKNWLVDRLRQITIAVGQQLGPYLTQAVESTSDTTKSGVNEACKIVNASLNSFGKVWSELENSASKIVKAVTAATVKSIKYKYGPDAGEAANLTLGAVASIGETAFTLDNIGAKVIADIGASYSDLDGRALEPMVFDEDYYNNKEEKGRNHIGESSSSHFVSTPQYHHSTALEESLSDSHHTALEEQSSGSHMTALD